MNKNIVLSFMLLITACTLNIDKYARKIDNHIIELINK